MANRRDLDPTSRNELVVLYLVGGGLLVAVLGGVWVALHGAASWAGQPPPPRHPVKLALDLASGKVAWTGKATVIAAAFAASVLILVSLIGWGVLRRLSKRKRPDRAARYLATRKDLQHLTAAGAGATARRLGVEATSPGVPLGKAIPTGITLCSSWEDMLVVVAGPRTMKSTAYAVPAIMAAPGAVLATSNKRDVVDGTRGPRAELGQVWIFDPQQVATTPRDWWWNPLTYIAPYDPATGRARRDPVTGYVAAKEARAEKLAGQFCASSIVAGAKTDAYFDVEAENLLGLLLLAAACGELTLPTVYTWLTTATDDAPIELLREHAFELQTQSLFALSHLPDKQREGVYGTARARMGFLRNRDMVAWVTPPPVQSSATKAGAGGPAPVRRQFHPVDFATSTDTLYPLSREGEGSAGPLVAALTVAVIDALEEQATASVGGRLAVPFVAVLDEAANICRFRNLDSYYSHFGSRGIIIETILQNWAQGEEVWGVKGMEKLWSAANIKVYGGGVDDDRFLRRLSDLIGTHTHISRSESSGRGKQGRSITTSAQERTTLTVGELRELPSGRAVLFASGTPAALIEPRPWFIGPDARVIEESLAAHAPKGSAVSSGVAAGAGVKTTERARRWTVDAPLATVDDAKEVPQ